MLFVLFFVIIVIFILAGTEIVENKKNETLNNISNTINPIFKDLISYINIMEKNKNIKEIVNRHFEN
jgi:hypothetical protein